VRFEGRLALDEGDRVMGSSAPLTRKDGAPLWSAMVPARGKAVLAYTVVKAQP